jgi:hypothetical protein
MAALFFRERIDVQRMEGERTSRPTNGSLQGAAAWYKIAS